VGPLRFHQGTLLNATTSLSIAYPKWYVINLIFAWVSAVGYFRMDLGVYYPNNVLANAIIGNECAFLTYKINK